MTTLTELLNNPEEHYPGNFDTPKRAVALLTGLCQDAAIEIENNGVIIQYHEATIERLNKALTWEQNRSGRIGTHDPGCHTWGPSHYECLLRVNQKLLAAMTRILEEPKNTMSDGKALKEVVRIARAAIATATKGNT